MDVPGEDDLAGEIEMEHTFRTLSMVRAIDCDVDTGEHIIEHQRLENLQEECAKDDHYRNLIQVTTTGFPVKPDLLPPGQVHTWYSAHVAREPPPPPPPPMCVRVLHALRKKISASFDFVG